MKSKEELNALKNEVEALNEKLSELSEEDLGQVAGGSSDRPCPSCGSHQIATTARGHMCMNCGRSF